MKRFSAVRDLFLVLAITTNSPPVSAETVGPFSLNFNELVTGTAPYQPVYTAFSFPRFDTSLGSLDQVHLAFTFSGTIGGSAAGVNESSSFNSSIDHWVFFDFADLSDNMQIAMPNLRLTATIPGQNSTISFGPEFQSSSLSFSVSTGDRRFDEWQNGPGDISGRLGVYFGNTTQGTFGLQFYDGTDSGVYGGQFSVAYEYVPVPEPKSLVIAAVTLSLCAFARSRHRNPV